MNWDIFWCTVILNLVFPMGITPAYKLSSGAYAISVAIRGVLIYLALTFVIHP